MSHSTVLFHATPVRNLPSILRQGLLPWFARGKRKAVWLCSQGRRVWAADHVASRHGVSLADVFLLRVLVDRQEIRRHCRGCWYAQVVIEPQQVQAVRPALWGKVSVRS